MQVVSEIEMKNPRAVADVYPTTIETFEMLSTTLEGLDILRAKVISGDLVVPPNLMFYLRLPIDLRTDFIRVAVQKFDNLDGLSRLSVIQI